MENNKEGWIPSTTPKKYADMKPTNPKDRAATYRVDLSLLPTAAQVYGSLAMTEGDCKYGGYNFREAGVSVCTYIVAMKRHIEKFENGEFSDPKTKVPHLGSIIACAGIIADGFVQGNIIDDRPPAQDNNQLFQMAEEVSKHLHETFPNGPKRCTEIKSLPNLKHLLTEPQYFDERGIE